MSFKWIGDMDIYEIIRRWHDGQTISHIAQTLGYDRKTVRKYIQQLTEKNLSSEKPLPPKEQVIQHIQTVCSQETHRRPCTAQQRLEPYLEEIKDLVNKREDILKPKSVFEVICEKYHLDGQVSYSTFKRFVRNNQIVPVKQRVTARIEVPPGSEVHDLQSKDRSSQYPL